MKLAIVYNKNDHKLASTAYSQTYHHMFDALIGGKEWECVQHVTEDCHSDDIDADVIVIYDIHSSHHIKIENLKSHRSVKYTYFNDPHQIDVEGAYSDGTKVHKLGAQNRVLRALDRGINFIICPYNDGYDSFIAPHLGSDAEHMKVWFPVAPRAINSFTSIPPLISRPHKILANGHLWSGWEGFRPYEFRAWAYSQENIQHVPHCLASPHIFKGNLFINLLTKFVAGLALTDWYVVPKYLEIPLAGCLCIAQKHDDYLRMGFKDNEHCIYVDRNNFRHAIKDILYDIPFYQTIADNGRKLAENNYTAAHFATYIFEHSKEQINGCSDNK